MESPPHTPSAQGTARAPGTPLTTAEALGQIVWLLSQSAQHRELKIKDLEWSFMPAVLHEQFRIFRYGPLPDDPAGTASIAPPGLSKEAVEQLPLGVAIWARLSEAAEAKLEQGERLSVDEWRSGERVWLVELISPFATKDNKLSEVMLLDLIRGPFRATPFSLHRTDPASGRREKVHMASHIVKT